MKKRTPSPTLRRACGLLALLMALCFVLLASAEAGTLFPWHGYTLDVTLATCDPELVDQKPAPSNGTAALVELTCVSGEMNTEDIEAYVGDFSLRDGDGVECAPTSWRLRGVGFDVETGQFSTNPTQKTVELLFVMADKDESAFEGAKLLVATEKKSERIVVTLSKAPSQREAESAESTAQNQEAATPEEGAAPAETAGDAGDAAPTDASNAPAETAGDAGNAASALPSDMPVEPATTPEPKPETPLEKQISALLAECAEDARDNWQKAIYEAGAREVKQEGTTVSLRMRSFNPQLKALGDYEEGKADYLARLAQNASAYDLEAELTLEEGEFTKKSVTAFKKSVAKAASAASKAFADKRVRAALVDWLLPSPAVGKVKEAEDVLNVSDAFNAWISANNAVFIDGDAKVWAPLFYGQYKQTLNVKTGPHALSLSCVSVSPEELLAAGSEEAFAVFAKQSHANQSDQATIEAALLAHLADQSISMRKKAKETFELTLDVDALQGGAPGEAYQSFMQRYQYGEVLAMLTDEISALPDYPALDFPKSGRLDGSTRGTKVIVKAPKDGLGRYIQLRDYNSNELAVTAFIRPGTSATVRVQQGDYYFLIASGETWYGPEEMFGDGGSYSRTELFEVASSRYYHTVTLKVTTGGNMSVYGEGADAFRQ